MLTINDLREFGANVDEGLGRCLNNEGFYLRLVGKAVADGNFEKLSAAVAAGDMEGGFEAAHSLKGVLANLALTPILDPVSRLTELFRHKEEGDYEGLLRTVLAERDRLLSLME